MVEQYGVHSTAQSLTDRCWPGNAVVGLSSWSFRRHCSVTQHHHRHQSLNCEGHWGTTDDFATSFLHFSLFSTALWDLPKSRSVHFLMLSSNLFLCLPCLLSPFTVPYSYKILTYLQTHTRVHTHTHTHTKHTHFKTWWGQMWILLMTFPSPSFLKCSQAVTIRCDVAVAVSIRKFRRHDTTLVTGTAEMCCHVPCPRWGSVGASG